MGNVLKWLTLAVSLLIVVILIVNVFGIQKTGKQLFDTGMDMLTENTAGLSESNYTQYDGSTVDGRRVIDLIKNNWVADNTVSICVCTKDGNNIMYDHDGVVFGSIADLKGFPTVDARNQPFANNVSTVKGCTITNNSGIATYDVNTGYGDANLNAAGYINASAPFKGSIQRDGNDNIRVITFIQK
jgi:hypothetical protein